MYRYVSLFGVLLAIVIMTGSAVSCAPAAQNQELYRLQAEVETLKTSLSATQQELASTKRSLSEALEQQKFIQYQVQEEMKTASEVEAKTCKPAVVEIIPVQPCIPTTRFLPRPPTCTPPPHRVTPRHHPRPPHHVKPPYYGTPPHSTNPPRRLTQPPGTTPPPGSAPPNRPALPQNQKPLITETSLPRTSPLPVSGQDLFQDGSPERNRPLPRTSSVPVSG